MKNKPNSVDDYISQFPHDIQSRLIQIREVFKKAFAGVEETIRYGMPAFKLGKEYLYIAAYKNHIGMYPMYNLDQIENELSGFRGKGTKDALHFSHAQPLPLALIEKIVIEKSSGAEKGWGFIHCPGLVVCKKKLFKTLQATLGQKVNKDFNKIFW